MFLERKCHARYYYYRVMVGGGGDVPLVGPRVFGHVQVILGHAFDRKTRHRQVIVGNEQRTNRPERFVWEQRVSAAQIFASPVETSNINYYRSERGNL